ncbi:hypothetical protein HTSR_0092 [Halodesulfurarchaeum formicicum]|uniref:Uncharacterized protein n=1 Tax=Halodesulfurarchaeum formicicum TaxID=1873524 RepID=A0A1D8S1R1_9EURY|nr:hypothetical protein [Halodesulfurarchaeum formicicum]AOW79302.1 hypothetical protein HTSR_0092 [Halodesulfurarchaeum formicicum]
MALSDIAEGVTATHAQEDRGVAVVDRTDASLSTVLAPYAESLPCGAETAATVVSTYVSGTSVGEAATAAGVAPITAAKTLHRLGFAGLSPLSPLQREICGDWLSGSLTRIEAQELADVGDRAFALGAYIETHDPIPGANETLQDTLSTDGDAMVEKRDALADTMTAASDLL